MRRPDKYGFLELRKGKSKFIPCAGVPLEKLGTRLRSMALHYGTIEGRKFVTRRGVNDDGDAGYTVWRMA